MVLALFLAAACTAAFRPPSLEKQLEKYLEGRLLVFRQLGVQGPEVKFDSGGRLASKSAAREPAGRTGILYLDLEVGPERLRLLGEPVRIVFQNGTYSAVRDPQKLNITSCTIVLDVPLEQLTLKGAVRVLARVFLTKAEFQGLVRHSRVVPGLEKFHFR